MLSSIAHRAAADGFLANVQTCNNCFALRCSSANVRRNNSYCNCYMILSCRNDHEYIYIYIYIYISVYIYIYLFIYLFMHTDICMYACMCIYVYIGVYVYTHTHAALHEGRQNVVDIPLCTCRRLCQDSVPCLAISINTGKNTDNQSDMRDVRK